MAKIKITRLSVEKLPVPADKPQYHFDEILAGFAVRVSPKGIKTYLVQGRIRGSGKVERVTLGRHGVVTPEEARARAREILSNMAAGTAPQKKRDLVLVSEALNEWLDVQVAHKLKRRTASDYRIIAEKVLKPAFGSRPVAAIERADLAALHHDRRDTPRRSNYILAVARSFFSWCEDAGHRQPETNPAKRIKAYPENRRERFLSVDELASAAAAVSECERTGVLSIWAAAALRLCILTGARQGEIRLLRWREVDLERRLLLLEDSKTGRRPIYLSEPAVAILATLPRVMGNEYVIAGARAGEPYANLTNAWLKVRRVAGLDDVRLHDLRHTFASFGAADSMSLPMIGRLLGHRVPATTARYAHLAADPVVAANDRLGRRLLEVMSGGATDAGAGRETVQALPKPVEPGVEDDS